MVFHWEAQPGVHPDATAKLSMSQDHAVRPALQQKRTFKQYPSQWLYPFVLSHSTTVINSSQTLLEVAKILQTANCTFTTISVTGQQFPISCLCDLVPLIHLSKVEL